MKKILNAGKKDTTVMFDENTLNKIQSMDKIVEEIMENIVNLNRSMEKVNPETVDYEILKQHMLTIIDYELLPIIEYFN